MLTLLHRPGSHLCRAHQPTVCLEKICTSNMVFGEILWYGNVSRQQPAEKQGIDGCDLQFPFQGLCCKGALIIFMLRSDRGTPGCPDTFWAPQQQEILPQWGGAGSLRLKNLAGHYPDHKDFKTYGTHGLDLPTCNTVLSLCHLLPSKNPTIAFIPT